MKEEMPFPTGSSVPFPYEQPYAQQLDLMNTILESLQARRLSQEEPKKASLWMLESPTGTGKSLSLAAATLAWLQYQEQEDLREVARPLHSQTSTTTTTSTATTKTDFQQQDPWWETWEPPQDREKRENENAVRAKAREARQRLSLALRDLRPQGGSFKRERRLQERQRILQNTLSRSMQDKKSRGKSKRPHQLVTPAKDDFSLRAYQSEDENERGVVLKYDDSSDEGETVTHPRESKGGLNNAFSLLQGNFLDGSAAAFSNAPNTTVGSVQAGSGVRKIIYAARTHSQLSQFTREVQRIPGLGASVRLVALGGRKALCGNTTLRQHHKAERDINEACLDLQKGSTNKKRKESTGATPSSGCPLLASREAVATLSLHILTEPTDIEEAAALGQSSQVCAYYASRQSLAAAQVVVLPYSMLLSSCTREAIGLSLRESLVIVDEAHNLPEALRSIHSSRLTLPVVQAALGQLGRYVEKYQDRLAGRNLFYLGQLRKTLLSFQKHLRKPAPKNREMMISVEDFLLKLKLQNTNFYKLLRYLQTSRLSQKLLGFMNHEVNQDDTKPEQGGDPSEEQHLSKHVSAMSIVETFLEKLTSTVDEGKIVTDDRGKVPGFRYVLLDPATFLAPILNEAHAVALVGGTLRPFGHVAAELIADTAIQENASKADEALNRNPVLDGSYRLINDKFAAFSCSHVVSPDNILLKCVSRGPTGRKLDFRHANRRTDSIVDELGQILYRTMKSVPYGGIVVFLPSYSYEAHIVRRWKQQGLWKDMQRRATVFREPKNSRDVDRTLKDYTACASKGALLLSVIGGKMSEGINFADDMARCVIIVGLPYPDITDPELQEKMAALDRSPSSGLTGKSYYQNLCMRAVNQSVGRAIRHANDYAAIMLLDERYSTDSRVWRALPAWLTSSGKSSSSFPGCENAVNEFFAKRTREPSS